MACMIILLFVLVHIMQGLMITPETVSIYSNVEVTIDETKQNRILNDSWYLEASKNDPLRNWHLSLVLSSQQFGFTSNTNDTITITLDGSNATPEIDMFYVFAVNSKLITFAHDFDGTWGIGSGNNGIYIYPQCLFELANGNASLLMQNAVDKQTQREDLCGGNKTNFYKLTTAGNGNNWPVTFTLTNNAIDNTLYFRFQSATRDLSCQFSSSFDINSDLNMYMSPEVSQLEAAYIYSFNIFKSTPLTTSTNSPSKHPTINPTNPTNPTNNPTINPTRNPSINPTTNPTINPTRYPTTNPTSNPTPNPSTNPTTHPMITPLIINDTINYTTTSTTNPTRDPTKNPTTNPTDHPTQNPSTFPYQSPSTSPSITPTLTQTSTMNPRSTIYISSVFSTNSLSTTDGAEGAIQSIETTINSIVNIKEPNNDEKLVSDLLKVIIIMSCAFFTMCVIAMILLVTKWKQKRNANLAPWKSQIARNTTIHRTDVNERKNENAKTLPDLHLEAVQSNSIVDVVHMNKSETKGNEDNQDEVKIGSMEGVEIVYKNTDINEIEGYKQTKGTNSTSLMTAKNDIMQHKLHNTAGWYGDNV